MALNGLIATQAQVENTNIRHVNEYWIENEKNVFTKR